MLFKRSTSAKSLSPAEANAQADLQIIDVRSREEWSTGHIDRAINIPLDQLPNHLAGLDTGQPVAFVCQSGTRSRTATKIAAQAGLDAINITGGMTAWGRAGLPTSTR
ncbi:MAG TPA: rhodanese-like domain-containing protein [Solirubrobacteraceae bacterium]|nr:rhodanese-like domain-containing protein [Solirubrobacteraceae bacterium]